MKRKLAIPRMFTLSEVHSLTEKAESATMEAILVTIPILVRNNTFILFGLFYNEKQVVMCIVVMSVLVLRRRGLPEVGFSPRELGLAVVPGAGVRFLFFPRATCGINSLCTVN